MNIKRIYFKTGNDKEKETIFKLLASIGFKFGRYSKRDLISYLKSCGGIDSHGFAYVYVTKCDKSNIASAHQKIETGEYVIANSISDFIDYVINNYLSSPETFLATVKLNDSYQATVTKENIIINGAIISHNAIKELYDASIQAQTS